LVPRSNPFPWNSSPSIAWNRREFLRATAGISSASALFGLSSLHAAALPRQQKAVVVTFGGGARDQETFAPEGHENIPGLLQTLFPQSTFFAQVVNHGILGHYVATSSIATGVYETFNNFTGSPPQSPTVFEYFRKGLKRPASDAWVVAPSNGFGRIGESSASGFGPGYGAGVILPRQLLSAISPGQSMGDLAHWTRDSYEEPHSPANMISDEAQRQQLEGVLKLSVKDFTQHAQSLSSADELSVYIARQLMRQNAPSLLWITLHDIDIAHSGAYSLYIDGIQRSDRLCVEIWNAIQSDPEYAGRTTLFILPDFGRDSDTNAGGNGFQHHRTGDPQSRTTWMMVLGPGIRQGAFIERAVDSLDLVPTLGKLLGFPTPLVQGTPLPEVL
jgi:hypothetical protein